MISLISEMTDAKGRRARGWVFFDADCRFCTMWARRFSRILDARGYGLAPLQSPRVRALLNLPKSELLRELRVLTDEGALLGGADAVIYLSRRIWWAWPLYVLAQLPGMNALLDAAYRRVAAHRTCVRGACATTNSATKGVLP
jgi:predicted DCC family thiol-disulfide oxidoreductase YuxK